MERKQLVFRVGDPEVVHEFWIASIQDPLIIGLDLLTCWDAQVDVAGAVITHHPQHRDRGAPVLMPEEHPEDRGDP